MQPAYSMHTIVCSDRMQPAYDRRRPARRRRRPAFYGVDAGMMIVIIRVNEHVNSRRIFTIVFFYFSHDVI